MDTNETKIKKVSTVDLITEKMKTFILDGTWALNKKIPSESELANIFGVNRFTVRMALQKLNIIGVLETKAGDGTYVRSFDFEKHMEQIYDFYMTPKLLDDITEFRVIIEVECARLAILRATPAELEILRQHCEKYEKYMAGYTASAPGSPEAAGLLKNLVRCDLELHSHLCSMSHNDLLIYAFSTAKEAIREFMITVAYKRIENPAFRKAKTSVKAHWDIYNSIKNKNFETCRKILTGMVNYKADYDT